MHSDTFLRALVGATARGNALTVEPGGDRAALAAFGDLIDNGLAEIVAVNGVRVEGGYKTAEIPAAWKRGERAAASALSTDGDNLFSYNLLIGVTKGGRKVLFDFRTPNKVSATTSQHVSRAALYADDIIEPPKVKVGGIFGFGGTTTEFGVCSCQLRATKKGRAALGLGIGGKGQDWYYYFDEGEREARHDGSASNPYKRGGWQHAAWKEGALYADNYPASFGAALGLGYFGQQESSMSTEFRAHLGGVAAFGRRPSSVILPGGKEVFMDEPKEKKGGKVVLMVALKKGGWQKMEQRAAARAVKVLESQGYDVDSISRTTLIVIPVTPIGPVPFLYKGWAVASIEAKARYSEDFLGGVRDSTFGDDGDDEIVGAVVMPDGWRSTRHRWFHGMVYLHPSATGTDIAVSRLTPKGRWNVTKDGSVLSSRSFPTASAAMAWVESVQLPGFGDDFGMDEDEYAEAFGEEPDDFGA